VPTGPLGDALEVDRRVAAMRAVFRMNPFIFDDFRLWNLGVFDRYGSLYKPDYSNAYIPARILLSSISPRSTKRDPGATLVSPQIK
jgi:hypothetical protein